MFQTQLQCKHAIRGLIHQLLTTILTAAPDASHVDLYAVTARHRPAGRGLMQYSLAASVTRGKRTKVQGLQDQPLTDWADFSRSMRAGRCRLLGLEDFRPSPIRDRFRAFDDGRILMCPVIGPQANGDLLGAVFLGCSGRGRVSAGAGSASMTVFASRIAGQVARVLELYEYASLGSLSQPEAQVLMGRA